jgi:type I restriction enzyme S subunit
MCSKRVEKLGDIASIQYGCPFDSKRFVKAGRIRIVRIRDIKGTLEPTFYNGDYEKCYEVNNGNILIGMDGEFNCTIWNAGKAVLNQRMAKIAPDPNLVDRLYLYYLLRTKLKLLEIQVVGATVKHLLDPQLRSIEIPLPLLGIQERIGSVLEKANHILSIRYEANQLANKITQSVFPKMFGGGKFPREKIGRHVVRTEVRNPRQQPDTSFVYVDIAGIDNEIGQIVKAREILGKDAPIRARRVIHTGDVIVSTVRPNLNATALVPPSLDNQICSTGFCVLRCRSSMNPRYLYAFTRGTEFIQALSSRTKGASYPAVTANDILDVKIPVPPIELQDRFSNILEEVELILERQKRSAVEIEELFQSLVQRAFKGELIV